MSDGVIPIGGDEQPIFGDQRREVVEENPLPVPDIAIPGEEPDYDPEAGLPSLRDIKGARARRGYKEWDPGFRKQGEDTTGAGAPAPPPSRRSVGAGPG